MNRLWAAAGLLAVLITICTLAVISTQSITTSITQDIIQIADTSLQDDKITALTLSRQAGEKWQNHHAVLCTFICLICSWKKLTALWQRCRPLELGRRSGYSSRM